MAVMESITSSTKTPPSGNCSNGTGGTGSASESTTSTTTVTVPTPVYEHATSVSVTAADYMVQYGAPAPLTAVYGAPEGPPSYATPEPFHHHHHEGPIMPCYPCPTYAEVPLGAPDIMQPFVPIDAYHTAYLQESRHAIGPNGKPKRKRVATMAQRRAANIRERRRMFNLNEAFDDLRKRVPTFAYEKRLSRIETLRLAIAYISFMSDLVKGKEPHEIRLAGIRSPGWAGVRPQDGGPTEGNHEQHYSVVYSDNNGNSASSNWTTDESRSRQEPEDDDTNSSTVST